MRQEIADLKAKKPLQEAEQDYTKFRSTNMETISRHLYSNETVEIDGKIFDHCIFRNATLTYRGIGPYAFINSNFEGNTLVQTENAAAKAFFDLVTLMKSRPDVQTFAIGEKDTTTGNIRILSKETKQQNVIKKDESKDGNKSEK